MAEKEEPQKDEAETIKALYGGIINGQSPYFPTSSSVTRKDNSNRWKADVNAGYYPKWMTTKYDSENKAHIVEFRPTRGNSSAFMINHGPGEPVNEGDDNDQVRKHLWVNKLSLGWYMDYREAQTVYGKSFFPRHIRYQDAVVRGQTATQNQYDEIVEAVIGYQAAALDGTPSIVRFVLKSANFHIDSEVVGGSRWREGTGDPKKIPEENVRRKYYRVQFDGYPLSIKAGHTNKSHQPEYEIRFALLAYQNEIKDVIVTNGNPKYTPKLSESDPYRDPVYQEYAASLQPKFAGDPSQTPQRTASNPLEESGYLSNFNAIDGGPSGNGG